MNKRKKARGGDLVGATALNKTNVIKEYILSVIKGRNGIKS